MTGGPGASGGYSGSYGAGRGAPTPRSFEDRAAAKEHMMQSLRDSSQQDRRVYVGNLSYDVKWHHLKDFMRQGMDGVFFVVGTDKANGSFSWGGSVRRCVTTSKWNVEGGQMNMAGFLSCFLVN